MSKKESYWFSHDSNAANNPKLLALIRKYGFEGYGRWWRLLERLRDCDDYKYHTGTPFAYEVLGEDLHMTADEAEAFVGDCINYFQLLESDGEYIWSDSMLDRMEYWERRREVLRARGRKGGLARGKNKSEADAQAQASYSLSTSNVKLKLNEANETKPNQTKQNDVDIVDDVNNNEEDDKDVDMEQEVNNELEQLKQRALSDGQKFVLPYVTTGRVNKEQLAEWLSAFNKWLAFTGEDVKAERDYRRHFAAWFRYRDTRKEDPRTYNPAGTINHDAPPPPDKSVPLPINIPETPPKGKYSKAENKKYDMHWLKNLRDEVRKMGESG